MDKNMSLLQDKLNSLFELSRDPVLGFNSEKIIAFANPAATKLLGVQPGDRAGSVVPAYILEETTERFVASILLGGKRASVAVNRVDEITVCSYSLPATEPVVNRQTRSLREISDALMNIRMALDLLVSHYKVDVDPVMHEASEILYREYYRITRSSNHMQLAADIDQDNLPLNTNLTDLTELCREMCDTLELLFEASGVSIRFSTEPGEHLTLANSDMLETMLLNLLTNSLAHCKAGDIIRMNLSRRGERFIIDIHDSCGGISPEKMTDILNRAPTENLEELTSGAGLGIYIARGIAERHGGSLMLTSIPEQGTTVRVSIPITRTEIHYLSSPSVQYGSPSMSRILTELSPILDKKFYNHHYFD